MAYVWYLGYGSNLCKNRLLCYITGQKFKWAGRSDYGCRDKTPPAGERPMKISHSLYFANISSKWENKAVAFVSPEPNIHDVPCTYARLWKITDQQLEDIWEEEGKGKSWYNKKLDLGEVEGLPVISFTNENILKNSEPRPNYVKTIALGLGETFDLANSSIVKYLKQMPGIRGNISEDQLIRIVSSAQ